MKVFPFKIPKPAGENLVVQVDREEVFYDRLHQHREIQVSYLVQGYGKLLVHDNVVRYRPGDLFVIGSEMPHLFRSEPREGELSHMISFFFTVDGFGKEFFRKRELQALEPFFRKSEAGMWLRNRADEFGEVFRALPDLGTFEQFLAVLQVLQRLGAASSEPLSGSRFAGGVTDADGARLQQVYDLVIRQFREPLSLQEIAGQVHMTPNAFCRYFKTRTNKTFFDFLLAVRIEHACELLTSQRELPIAAVAYASGFRTLSNFNRKFRELQGVTPKEYRRKN